MRRRRHLAVGATPAGLAILSLGCTGVVILAWFLRLISVLPEGLYLNGLPVAAVEIVGLTSGTVAALRGNWGWGILGALLAVLGLLGSLLAPPL